MDRWNTKKIGLDNKGKNAARVWDRTVLLLRTAEFRPKGIVSHEAKMEKGRHSEGRANHQRGTPDEKRNVHCNSNC